jgi:hypothetical protein
MRDGGLRIAVIAALSAALVAAGAAAQQRGVDRLESAIRQLERAAHPQRDGSHLPRILALRQLEDPGLRPFYRDLARRSDWQLQVHGALGLAETNDPTELSVELAAGLSAQAQTAAIANAIDLKLIPVEGLRGLAAMDELQPLPRLLAVGELMMIGESVDRTVIERLAAGENLELAGLASVLLARLGDNSGLNAINQRIADAGRVDRERQVNYLVESIRQYEAIEAIDWLKAMADDPALRPETRYWAVHALLELDPRIGLAALRDMLRADGSLRTQVRASTLLLASADELPAESAVLLTTEHPLLDAVRSAIRSFRDGAPSATAVKRLLDLEHMRTTQWILGAVEEWPKQTQIDVWEHMIDSIAEGPPARADQVSRAVAAAGELMKLEPERLIRRLTQAEDGSLLQEVLLMGMLTEQSGAALRATRELERVGAGRADSLAVLVIARNSDALSADELEMLGVVAAGGGRVSDGLQTQAAWLYVQHVGAAESALERMMAKSGGD